MSSLLKAATLFKTRIKDKKVHRVFLEFEQSKWLKPCIKFNTRKTI